LAISVDEAMSSYGYVYAIAKSIPELNTYLQQALKEGWSPDKLTATIESSKWWMSNADTVRNLAIQHAAEPGTYKQTIANAVDQISLRAQALGRSLSNAEMQRLAVQTLVTNSSWDTNRLDQLISANSAINTGGGTLHSGAAQLADHMTQVAQSYGVPYTQAFLNQWITTVQGGHDTVDGFENLMRARAKATYPNLAAQLDAGMTVKDIADPYISTYAQTLEIPETQVTLNDPAIKKALSQVDPKTGVHATQPMWQFQQAIKQDPRYDRTVQAKTDAYSTLGQIAKDFGFSGGTGGNQ
jgi:hypothetical protein